MKTKLKMVLSLAFIATLSISVQSFGLEVERISGNDRYDTALKISETFFKESDNVILASGENYPDALLGGSLATQIKAPILLTRRTAVPNITSSEIKRLSPKQIYVLGGINTISQSSLHNLFAPNTYIYRIAGNDRYETAQEINALRASLFYDEDNNFFEDGITRHYFSSVYGKNFYDALYAAPYYGFYRTEYNDLTYLDLIPENTIEDLEVTAHAIGDITVIYSNNEYKYTSQTRGKNRYHTSVIMAKRFKERINKNLDTVVLVSGENYPDGLSASGVSAVEKAPVVLSPTHTLDSYVASFLKDNHIKKVIIVGGENSVSKNVENELRSI